MRASVAEILEHYGQEVTVRRESGEETVRAFLQPLRERNETVPETQSPIGWVDGRLWLYLGQARAEEGGILLSNGGAYRVRSGRPVYVGEELTHWRAVLEREKEATGCGN